MANNTTLDPGAGGDTIATDDVAGVKYQRVKLVDGTEDSATGIPGDATNGLDVDVTRLPSGTVAGGSSLPAGTNNIGDVDVLTLPSIPAGANNIGDVDVLTVPADPFGANADAAATAGSTGSIQAKLRLMTAQLDSIKTSVETLDNAIAGSEMQVDVVTMPSTAVTNAGTFVTQENGGALTALQLIDDTIIADDAAFTVATTKVSVAGFLADQASTDSVNEGDAGAARMTLDRKQIITVAPSADTEGLTISTLVSAASTNATSVKASAGKVYGWYIYNDGAAEVYFKLYNKASAPTVGTDVPVMTLGIPAGGGANQEFTNGITFATGIAFAVTTGATTADTGAVALSQVVSNLLYQ